MNEHSPYYYIKEGVEEEEAFLLYLWENEIYDIGLVYAIDAQFYPENNRRNPSKQNHSHKEVKAK